MPRITKRKSGNVVRLLGFWNDEDDRNDYDLIDSPEIYVPADWTNPSPCLLVTRKENGAPTWEGAIVAVAPYLAEEPDSNLEIVAGVAWVAAKERKKIKTLQEFSINKEWQNRFVETLIPAQNPRPLVVLHREGYEGSTGWEILRHWKQWTHSRSLEELYAHYRNDVHDKSTGTMKQGQTRTNLLDATAMTIGAFSKLLAYSGLPASTAALLEAYPPLEL